MQLRPANDKDAKLLYSWVNDKQIRAAAFSTAPITWEQHLAWYSSKLADPNCMIVIAQNEYAKAYGQIRFDIENQCASIDVHTDPLLREKGVGTELIKKGCEEFIAAHPHIKIQAVIKKNNARSYKAFIKAGFVISDIQNIEQCNVLIWDQV